MAKAKSPHTAAPAKIALWSGYGTPENMPPAWRYVWCGGYDEVDDVDLEGNPIKRREYHHFTNKRCDCPPGPQVLALTTQADEVAIGGGRGGLKTETGFAFIVRGNPGSHPGLPLFHFTRNTTYRLPGSSAYTSCKKGDEFVLYQELAEALERDGRGKIIKLDPTPENLSYIHHPLYRVLVLRKTADDLRDWFHRGKTFFGRFGATASESPTMIFRFPSGAEIILNHMQDENVYEKYQGQQFQTIIFEEATQVPSKKLFEKIAASCRSTIPGIKSRLLLTANPGGKGHSWFRETFARPIDKNGSIIKPGTVFRDCDTYDGSRKDKPSSLSRIFIHSTVYDNPYFMQNDASYVERLEALSDEVERKKWLDGDFDAIEGQYFGDFRETRRTHEPVEACHVVPEGSVKLMPWWNRWIGMDWGYKHCTAVYFACQHPNSQVHIYRELVVDNVGAENLGVLIAEAAYPDLEGLENHHMTLWVGKDVMGERNDTKSIGQLIADGIARVLGPEHVIIADEKKDFFDQREAQSQSGITIRRAMDKRVLGWQYMRSLMRWKRMAEPAQMDSNYLRHLSYSDTEKYTQYVRAHQVTPEVLPKLQIHSGCKRLIQAIPTACYSDDLEDVQKTETWEDDVLDSIRYTLISHSKEQNRKPFKTFFEEHMNRAVGGRTDLTGGEIVWAARRAEQKWEENSGLESVFTVPRFAGRRARGMVQ